MYCRSRKPKLFLVSSSSTTTTTTISTFSLCYSTNGTIRRPLQPSYSPAESEFSWYNDQGWALDSQARLCKYLMYRYCTRAVAVNVLYGPH